MYVPKDEKTMFFRTRNFVKYLSLSKYPNVKLHNDGESWMTLKHKVA